MPGSAYYKIAKKTADWLKVVPECNVNTSSQRISSGLSEIELPEGHEIISFDIVSLYTNVPVNETIDDCTELLFSGRYEKPPVDKETFREMLNICSCDVIMLTLNGYYQQTNGLAMGSPPAPMLANGWLSKFDPITKGEAMIYERYADAILMDILRTSATTKLESINSLHVSLRFTEEREHNGNITFLDMLIQRNARKLSSTWYTKRTDTGLMMNFLVLAPVRYKKAVILGMIHGIYQACSSWKSFHESLEKAKTILINNQYPRSFYDPIIEKTLNKIIEKPEKEEDDKDLTKFYIQYRGKVSDKFEKSLRQLNEPCKVVFTTRKLKTILPSLKPKVEKHLRSSGGLAGGAGCAVHHPERSERGAKRAFQRGAKI
ncbi:uncharacterized protein [Clytia hemisphaerica]|uniref:uncharacterized protein n=1 Tax=Clytia hemisphaerica TaxID=252671 RepID=UPI0034D64184